MKVSPTSPVTTQRKKIEPISPFAYPVDLSKYVDYDEQGRLKILQLPFEQVIIGKVNEIIEFLNSEEGIKRSGQKKI